MYSHMHEDPRCHTDALYKESEAGPLQCGAGDVVADVRGITLKPTDTHAILPEAANHIAPGSGSAICASFFSTVLVNPLTTNTCCALYMYV